MSDFLASVFVIISCSNFLMNEPSFPGSGGACNYIMPLITVRSSQCIRGFGCTCYQYHNNVRLYLKWIFFSEIQSTVKLFLIFEQSLLKRKVGKKYSWKNWMMLVYRVRSIDVFIFQSFFTSAFLLTVTYALEALLRFRRRLAERSIIAFDSLSVSSGFLFIFLLSNFFYKS